MDDNSINWRSTIKIESSNDNNSTITSNRPSDNTQQVDQNMSSRRAISPDAIFPPIPHRSIYDPQYHNEQPTRRRRELSQLDNRIARFDYRRPVMSSIGQQEARNTETIDLTRDVTNTQPAIPVTTSTTRRQRLPRYNRDIIELTSSDIEGSRPSDSTYMLSHESPLFVPQDDEPDLEFISSRPLSTNTSRNTSARPGATDSRNTNLIDLTVEDDDIQFTHSRTLPQLNANGPTFGLAGVMRAVNQHHTQHQHNQVNALLQETRRLRERVESHPQARNARRPAFAARTLDRELPPWSTLQQTETRPARRFLGNISDMLSTARAGLVHYALPDLDYHAAAFDLGAGSTRRSPEAQQYNSPAPPPPEYTRSPGENEVVVCPNCGHELAMGEEDTQRQVWVIKACGHAYCGKCVQRKLQSTGRRSKARAEAMDTPPLLMKCVAPGCENQKNVTKSTVVHVFLSD